MILELSDREEFCDWLPRGLVIAELGVDQCLFSNLLLNTKPKELHLFDMWSLNNRQVPILDGATFHDGLIENTFTKFPSDYFDMVYVDAQHFYNSTIQNIDWAYERLKPNGLLCGHDMTSDMRPRQNNSGFGIDVIRAVIDFLQTGRGQLICMTRTHWPDWAIRIKK